MQAGSHRVVTWAGAFATSVLFILSAAPRAMAADPCLAAGGTPVSMDGALTCKFGADKLSGGNCPATWKNFKNWTTTQQQYVKAGCNCPTCTCVTAVDSLDALIRNIGANIDAATKADINGIVGCGDCYSGEHTALANKSPETSMGKRAVVCGSMFNFFSCTATVTSRLCVK